MYQRWLPAVECPNAFPAVVFSSRQHLNPKTYINIEFGLGPFAVPLCCRFGAHRRGILALHGASEIGRFRIQGLGFDLRFRVMACGLG